MNALETGETYIRWVGLLHCNDCNTDVIAPTTQPSTSDHQALENSVLQVAVFGHGQGMSGMQRCNNNGGLS